MEKVLKVIKPFLMMDEGDTFERTDNNSYVSEYNNEFSLDGADGDMSSSYTSSFEISESYAKSLVNKGFLAEEKTDKDFVNVFDEIDKLIDKYAHELDTLEDEMKNAPACLKIEKETVLRNLVKTLDYLKSLKK